MGEMLRVFIAVELPPPVVQNLETLTRELKQDGLKLRWVKSNNIHMTLKFLGEVPQKDIAAIEAAMSRVSGVAVPSSLHFTLQGMGVFPNIRRPRVLWVGIGGDLMALDRLFKSVDAHLADEGFAEEQRAFKPHLTLARIPDRGKSWGSPHQLLQVIEDRGKFVSDPFECRQLTLFKSDLRPTGAQYTVLSKVDL